MIEWPNIDKGEDEKRMNSIFKLDEVYTDNMVRVTVNDNKRETDLDISIVYQLPTNVHSDLDGVPHMFEHLVFNDIIDNCNSSELISMAEKVGCSVNAYTSNKCICFVISVNSFELPKYVCSTNAYSRFDISEEGYKFAKKFVKGVISPHLFSESELEKEKDIIISEFSAISSITQKVHATILDMLFGYTLIGKNEDAIRNITLKEVNNFAKSLPKPHIVISYNSDVTAFSYAVEDMVSLVEKIVKPPKGNVRVGQVKRAVEQDIVEVETCYNFKTHHKGYKHTNLNTISFAVPVNISNEISDITENIYKNIAMDYIFSLSEGSLGEYLREVKGLIYGIHSYGVMNRDEDNLLLMFAAQVNSAISIKDPIKAKGLIKTIDKFLSEIVDPSEEQFISDLRNYAMYNKNRITYGPSQVVLVNNICQGRDISYLKESMSLEQNFNYSEYLEAFRTIVDSIQIILI